MPDRSEGGNQTKRDAYEKETPIQIFLMPAAATLVTTWNTEQMMLEMVHDRATTRVTCCTATWKENGEKLPHLLFLGSLFQKK